VLLFWHVDLFWAWHIEFADLFYGTSKFRRYKQIPDFQFYYTIRTAFRYYHYACEKLIDKKNSVYYYIITTWRGVEKCKFGIQPVIYKKNRYKSSAVILKMGYAPGCKKDFIFREKCCDTLLYHLLSVPGNWESKEINWCRDFKHHNTSLDNYLSKWLICEIFRLDHVYQTIYLWNLMLSRWLSYLLSRRIRN
jgi:hypothetical protein